MTKREQLKREIDTIDETYLEVLYRIILSFKKTSTQDISPSDLNFFKDKISENAQDSVEDEFKSDTSLLSKLKQIQISAPPDFSEKIDDYLTGEKDV